MTHKLSQLINDATLGVWFIITGITVIIGKRILQGVNKAIDFVWQSMFEKGARTVGSVIAVEIKKELEPIKERVQRIEHKLKNQDTGQAGAFDLILEDLREIKESTQKKKKK